MKNFLPQLLPKNDPRYKKWKKSLKKRPSPWNKGKNKETDLRVKKISSTMKSKKIDNFKKWRDKRKKTGKIKSHYPPLPKNSKTAELIGLTLGDGNLYQYPRTEQLLISFNSKYPQIIKRARLLIKNTFNKAPRENRGTGNCTRIWIYEKYISKRLEIPSGAKKNHNLSIPKWIWKSKNLLISCLIGLYNAEGSYSIHSPTCTYNFGFANNNKALLKDVHKALKILKYTPHLRKNKVTLRKKSETKSFAKLIKFKYYRKTTIAR